MIPNIEESHLSDIMYKAHMGKTIICRILAVLDLCMVITCMCICARMSKNLRFFAVYLHKETSLAWLDRFLVLGIYCFLYKHPAKSLSMVIMLHSYLHVLNCLADP